VVLSAPTDTLRFYVPENLMARRLAFHVTRRVLALMTLVTLPLLAQRRAKAPVAPPAAALPAIAGVWSGTATVPLGDSTVVVPVTYTFAQNGQLITGTAVVPGRRSGPIANVVREGKRLRFRVTTAPEGKLLEHDGTFVADGAVEGMVNMDNLPVAKFRIVQRAPATAPR
jgi:hypothetical protein